ncbi:choline/carnitine O-acyltransferase [Luteipulveratus mongoliensis]|uniref:Carnitine O-acetyltransferase n=1 Tax=Luteipulveratus mongoliensis TaxID=571913 RepID=A0A0K1JDZ9_9MICO|nr:choline/carnitine O-acyltransferase [Luteipulveratus mongoliensis]AKU14942.1 carnitine O-acetyltransferase [Luteipulveratus mongoliensis]
MDQARTFALEDDLPRVPLPTVERSCELFLEWCRPLLTADELRTTEAAVADFLKPDSPSHTLHQALAAYDARPEVASWLDTFWPYRYLGRRDRIALNANFFFLFQDLGESQVERASGLIAGALGYRALIDDERLPVATRRGTPLSMEQNKYLFSATRIPGVDIDTARTPYAEAWPGPSRERHVVVLHRGAMYRLDVIGEGGRPHTMDEIAAGLRAVLDADAPGQSVGCLTSLARAEWAADRQALLQLDPANAAALDIIETALFCVCLEDDRPGDAETAGDLLLYGGRGNRWFDKALSFIVFADGTAGINCEHCCLDGTTVVSLVDALHETPAREASGRSGAEGQGTPAPVPIRFVLDTRLEKAVEDAGDAFADYGASTATTTVSMDVGTDQLKALGVSPDGLAQMAFQIAHRRTKGHVGATYESIAMRHYRHGRTEAMRVVTPEVVDLLVAMDEPGADDNARRAALRAAIDAHVARARQCQAGDAPEQHLWELLMIQQRQGAELGATEPLALYETPGWRIMRDDYLSTSAVPSANVQYFGFGATGQSCIGVGYALLPNRFNAYLCTAREAGEALQLFADQLREVVSELRALLAGGSSSLVE